jgi:hypothetical protein
MAADNGNAYLNADCREKIFGSKQGRVLIIKKALYGPKSSGAAWRCLFSSTLHKFVYAPCRGGPVVHIMRAIGDIYTLKHDSLKPPAVYLGANIGEVMLFNPTRMDVQGTAFFNCKPVGQGPTGFWGRLNIAVWADVRLHARLCNHVHKGFTGSHE